MNQMSVEFPSYVISEFGQPLGHPKGSAARIQSITRTFLLINEALKEIISTDWEVEGTDYKSKYDNEPYGFEKTINNFVIYVKQRGEKSAIAKFHSDHIAAEYFVWLVSKGKAEIDWSLFLELEP